jgi:A/G-specific adenine glycosylase
MKKKAKKKRGACDGVLGASADRAMVEAVAGWFARDGRVLPWRKVGRGGRRDAWRSLVSEVMLQQTQVSRVVERFEGFMERFPTPGAMAEAGEAAVLAMWSGMGYYRRARLLFAAATTIVERFGGEVPWEAAALRMLPGVGRYTAGAVASIVFGKCEAIVDGNVSRVLLRIHGVEKSAAEGAAWCWERAEELVSTAGEDVAGFNEGLMELGAVVCTPRRPRCGACPAAAWCAARRAGTQELIPTPKPTGRRSVVRCEVVVVRDGKGRVLVERRLGKGMWAGLWQAPTVERPGAESATPIGEVVAALGLRGARVGEGVYGFTHQTTHREVVFEAREGRAKDAKAAAGMLKVPTGHAAEERRWVTAAELKGLGVSNAQKRILDQEAGLFGGGGV